MELFNPLCVDREGCVGSSASDDKNVKKQKNPVVVDSGSSLVPSAEFARFPADVSHLVGDYLPMEERPYVETAFAGVQPIILCLSQDVGSKLASFWSIGFLPPNRRWEPSDVKIDKEHLIKDYKGCLQLLEQNDSNYCRAAVEVLVVKFSETLNDFPSTLYDLRITIEELKDHLSSVKHVVISIKEYASCCFTLNNAIGNANEMRQPVDHSKAIFKIINDLYICWSNYRTLTVRQLFTFYFKSRVKRASDAYLAKFVIPLNTDLNRKLFDNEASKMLSTKIMWICSVCSEADLINIDQNITNKCHAFYFNDADLGYEKVLQLGYNLERVCYMLEGNPFLERIVIVSRDYGRVMQMPRPSEPLTDFTPRSALIELLLEGESNTLHLSQLNDGYFPNLMHLSITEGLITGQLDSYSVPKLKTLIIDTLDMRHRDVVRKHTQSLLNSGLPWQLAASESHRGWSLASYDKPIPNPRKDGKEDALPSPPIIRELMLVMGYYKDADEFQSRLSGEASLKAAVDNQNNVLLEWAPERVEKITAFSTSKETFWVKLFKNIPGQTRILTSLVCHYVDVMLHGDDLPHLQLVKVHGVNVTLSGAFPQLKTLSFRKATFFSPWEVDTPLLESLDCDKLTFGSNLSLRPELLPRLSYLRITPWTGFFYYIPKNLGSKGGPGLSRVNHVVLGKGMTDSPDFDQWQVHMVSHLELDVNVSKLPVCWEETRWLCDTMTLNFYEPPVEHSDSKLCGSKHSDSDSNNDDSNNDDSNNDDDSDDDDSDDDSNDSDDSDDESAPKKKLAVFTFSHMLLLVKTLTVTEDNCKVILDSEMPELTDLFVPSPESLGPNLLCHNLTCIHFTGKLSDIEKDLCLDRATYKAIDAQPRLVYFGNGSDAKKMLWDVAPNKKKVVLPLDEPLKKGD